MDENYEVVVVGGGAAGLAAALTLSRARRSVLVVDAGEPRNAPADRVHNYLGREGTPPGELLTVGRAEVAAYGGHVVTGTVTAAHRDGAGFAVTLADGATVTARRLIVAAGLVDELPDVPGLAGRWGRDVLHCPYCHGWEVRDQQLAVLGTGQGAVHQALLWRQWSAELTLVRHAGVEPTGEEWELLAARGISVVDGEVAEVEVTDDRVTALRLRSGVRVGCQAVVVRPLFVARSAVLDGLGLATEEQEMGGIVFGRRVPAGPMGATTVPGVWVAGNVTDLVATVAAAAASGVMAAGALNADLAVDDARLAAVAR